MLQLLHLHKTMELRIKKEENKRTGERSSVFGSILAENAIKPSIKPKSIKHSALKQPRDFLTVSVVS